MLLFCNFYALFKENVLWLKFTPVHPLLRPAQITALLILNYLDEKL